MGKITSFLYNLVERLHGTVRDRNKVQRGLEIEDSPFVKGHQLYYNFIREHEALENHTPAEISHINLNLGNKKWENILKQSLIYCNGGKNGKRS